MLAASGFLKRPRSRGVGDWLFICKVALLMLPLWLPESLKRFQGLYIGAMSIGLPEVVYGIFAVLGVWRLFITTHKRPGFVALVYILFLHVCAVSALRTMAAPELFPWVAGALVEALITVFSAYYLAGELNSAWRRQVVAAALVGTALYLVGQEIVFSLIITGTKYVTQNLGVFARVRTTVGTGTATGHVIVVFLILADLVGGHPGKGVPPWVRLVLFGGVLLSASRAAIIIFTAYEAFRLALQVRQKRVLGLLFGLCVIAVAIYAGGFVRFGTISEASDQARQSYLVAGIAEFTESGTLVTGAGLGTVYARRGTSELNVQWPSSFTNESPHNSFLVVANELGALGLILVSVLLALPVAEHLKAYRTETRNRRPWLLAVCGYLLYLVIGGNTETLLFNEVLTGFPIGLLYAIGIQASGWSAQENTASEPSLAHSQCHG